MSKKEIALWIVLADFTALTVYAVATQGYFGFYEATLGFVTSSIWGAQVVVDFVVALTIAMGWMIKDAREQGLPYWPYVAATLVLGSIACVSRDATTSKPVRKLSPTITITRMRRTRTGRRVALFSAAALALLCGVLAWVTSAELISWYAFWHDFESLGRNAQGNPEFRHEPTAMVFLTQLTLNFYY